MARLAAVLESLDGVAEPLRELYVEVEGQYVLDADVEGHPAVGGLKSALEKERKAAKDALAKARAGGDTAEVERLRAELDELKTKAGGDHKPDVESLRKKWDAEAATARQAIETERDAARRELRTLRLDGKLREAALAAGVRKTAIEDLLEVTRRHFDLDDKGRVVVLDDDGDPSSKTMERFFETLKDGKPWFFEGAPGAGTGARPGAGSAGVGGVLTLSREDAKDPRKYQAARARAEKDGLRLEIAAAT